MHIRAIQKTDSANRQLIFSLLNTCESIIKSETLTGIYKYLNMVCLLQPPVQLIYNQNYVLPCVATAIVTTIKATRIFDMVAQNARSETKTSYIFQSHYISMLLYLDVIISRCYYISMLFLRRGDCLVLFQ